MPVFTDYPTTKQTSLGDLIGGISNIQNFQQQQQLMPLQLEKAQLELERQRQTQNPEIARIQSLSRQQLGIEKPAITLQEQLAEQALTTTEKQRYELNAQQQEHMDTELGSVIPDPRVTNASKDPEAAKEAILELRKRLTGRGLKETTVEAHLRPYLDLIEKKPEALSQALTNVVNRGQNAQQFAQANQAPTQVTTNTATNLVPVSPFQPNRPTQVFPQLPGPSTEEVAQEGNPYGLPVGTKFIPPVGARQTNAPIVKELATSVTAPIEQANTFFKTDWNKTVEEATQAVPRKAVLQNIKKLAPESFTGVGGARKELAVGVANALSIPYLEAEKTATDELRKNSTLLAIAGGNTDLARQMAEAANPNNKMNEQAIKNVVDQLIGAENMKTARFQYLSKFKNDPATYQQKSAEFTPFMDSRLYQEMSKQEVEKLKASMSPADRKEIGDKIREARRLGIIK
jgi:hypothetical protein